MCVDTVFLICWWMCTDSAPLCVYVPSVYSCVLCGIMPTSLIEMTSVHLGILWLDMCYLEVIKLTVT